MLCAMGAERRIRVRAAADSDLEKLVAFNLAMALETEERRLDPARLRSGVERALRDGARGSYRVAELGGEVAGCLLLTREWSDWRDGWYWWIQSVYVAPSARRLGVYRALHAAVLEEARAEGDVCALRLYVDTENRSAQSTYQRLGMERARYLMYEAAVT